MAELFELVDLAAHLHKDLDGATAQRARRKASGELRAATRLPVWPDPVPDDLWGWAVELAGLFYDNPLALTSDTQGASSLTYRNRRAEILEAAASVYASGVDPYAGGGGGVNYVFPDGEAWPDPVPTWRGWVL